MQTVVAGVKAAHLSPYGPAGTRNAQLGRPNANETGPWGGAVHGPFEL